MTDLTALALAAAVIGTALGVYLTILGRRQKQLARRLKMLEEGHE